MNDWTTNNLNNNNNCLTLTINGSKHTNYFSSLHSQSTDMIQLNWTHLKMTTKQVIETSVTVNNSPIQDYVHQDNHTQPTYYYYYYYYY